MRALAVSMVIATHAVPAITTGGAGVSIFFVLSGYLITGILIKDIKAVGAINRRLFYARRALRLWPALVAMLLGTALLGASIRSVLIAGSYTTNLFNTFGVSVWPYGHTWSLAEEEQFYLLWPLLLPLCLRNVRRSIPVLAALAALSLLGGWLAAIYAARSGDSLIVYNPLWNFHGLVIGCILALITQRRPAASRRYGEIGLTLLVVSLIIGKIASTHIAALGWNALTPELAAALLIVGITTDRESLVTRAFQTAPAVWMGRRSYAIYLWHLPLIELLAGRFPHSTLVAIALTFVLAEISARVIEAPFLRLKDRLHPSDRLADRPGPRQPNVQHPSRRPGPGRHRLTAGDQRLQDLIPLRHYSWYKPGMSSTNANEPKASTEVIADQVSGPLDVP